MKLLVLKKRRAFPAVAAVVVVVLMTIAMLLSLFGEQASQFRQRFNYFERSLQVIPKKEFSYKHITPFEEICPEENPPVHPTLHDRRPEQVQEYYQIIGAVNSRWNGNADGNDIPQVQVLRNQKIAVWHTDSDSQTEASVWEDVVQGDGSIVRTTLKGPGWRDPVFPDKQATELKGDYVLLTSWFLNNFGHFVHDHLPTIGFLQSVVPETTRFLLVENPTSKKILKFLDPVFYERISWIPRDKVYYIPGELTVAIPLVGHPIMYGCCGGWDPLREWIARIHPNYPLREEQRTVVFYSRSKSATYHGRTMEPQHEREVQKHIREAMVRHGRKERFVIFTGNNGKEALPILDQYQVFRSASTIIGPHGSGIGGNFIWTNPYPKTCKDRTQLLEFIPGPDSAHVQAKYASYFGTIRRWPLDYHQIFYAGDSTKLNTKVNLQDLDDALDAMWGNPSTRVTSS